MTDIEFEFDVFHPVLVISEMDVAEHVGKMYKYDFPKMCAEKDLRCFYKPETRVYVVIPKSLKEL